MKLPRLFTDGLVVQQGLAIPVWGWAKALQRIRVSLGGVDAETQADAKGIWMVKLPKLRASEYRNAVLSLHVQGDEELIVSNVLVGEVWLCAGEGAMHLAVDRTHRGELDLAKANHPHLRLFQVRKAGAPRPLEDVQASAAWHSCTPATAASFSAVAYHFGRELLDTLDLPVGLIQATWGQTMAESWTSRAALASENALGAILRRIEMAGTLPKPDAADFKRRMQSWQDKAFHRDPGNKGSRRGWQKPDLADAHWPTLQQPGSWQSHGVSGNGALWLRRHVALPKEWRGKALTLSLGPIADSDTTYFNGTVVGCDGASTGLTKSKHKRPTKAKASPEAIESIVSDPAELDDAEPRPRLYEIPSTLVKGGDNLLAIRVFNKAAEGGLIGSAAALWLELRDKPASGKAHTGTVVKAEKAGKNGTTGTVGKAGKAGVEKAAVGKVAKIGKLTATNTPSSRGKSPSSRATGTAPVTRISLAGAWTYQVEVKLDPPTKVSPPPLHNAHPDIPATISNAMIQPLVPYGLRGAIWYQGVSNVTRAVQYRTLLATMIKDWRIAWGQGDFPFGIVQLPGDTALPTPTAEKAGTVTPDSAWAELREAQALAASQPRNGLALAIDLTARASPNAGEQEEIARRLGLWARAEIYQQPHVWNGPQFASHQVEGARIRVTFTNAHGGLSSAPDKELRGFSIAGHDRTFVAAEATIDGVSVLVQCASVAAPLAVRYAWADRPACTLRNGAGLPAAPFRTDSWDLSTQAVR